MTALSAPEEPTPRPWRLPDLSEYGRRARARLATILGSAAVVSAAIEIGEDEAVRAASAEREAQAELRRRSESCQN